MRATPITSTMPTTAAAASTPAQAPWRALAGTVVMLAYGAWCLAWLWLQPRAWVTVASLLLPCLLFACGSPAVRLRLAVAAPLARSGADAGNFGDNGTALVL